MLTTDELRTNLRDYARLEGRDVAGLVEEAWGHHKQGAGALDRFGRTSNAHRAAAALVRAKARNLELEQLGYEKRRDALPSNVQRVLLVDVVDHASGADQVALTGADEDGFGDAQAFARGGFASEEAATSWLQAQGFARVSGLPDWKRLWQRSASPLPVRWYVVTDSEDRILLETQNQQEAESKAAEHRGGINVEDRYPTPPSPNSSFSWDD